VKYNKPMKSRFATLSHWLQGRKGATNAPALPTSYGGVEAVEFIKKNVLRSFLVLA